MLVSSHCEEWIWNPFLLVCRHLRKFSQQWRKSFIIYFRKFWSRNEYTKTFTHELVNTIIRQVALERKNICVNFVNQLIISHEIFFKIYCLSIGTMTLKRTMSCLFVGHLGYSGDHLNLVCVYRLALFIVCHALYKQPL